MSQQFVSAGKQIVGERDNQEDAYLIVPLEGSEERSERLLVVLADGMGGHAAGQVASDIVVRQFQEYFTQPGLNGEPRAQLQEALDIANRAVGDAAKANPAYQGMGCTVVAALCEQGRMWWISVGDSHLYLLRENRVEKLNADHSYGGYLDAMAARGEPVSNEQNLPRNMLMSAIIGEPLTMVDLPDTPYELSPKDRLVLASDGLDTLAREELALKFEPGIAPTDYADRLIQAVERAEKPRQDNTTVAVVEVRATAVVSPAPEPELLAPAAAPKKSLLPLIAGAVGLLAAAGVAVYFLVLAPKKAPSVDVAAVEDTATRAEAQAGAPPAEEVPEAKPLPPLAPVTVESVRDRLRGGGEGPEMQPLPGGTYTMGQRRNHAAKDQYPPHPVTVAPFLISRFEVSVADYARFANATGRRVPKSHGEDPAHYPASGISWNDATAYAEWLSAQTGKRYRLPTEAEWEYAARAGQKTPYWWGHEVGKGNARCFDCEEQFRPTRPVPTGTFAASPYGLHDTAGNLAEWVQDCYHKNYQGAPEDGSAWQEKGCAERVTRGGSYINPSSALRVTARGHLTPETALEDLGIRLARDP